MYTDVYLTLNGDVIPNHGYVEISEIGSTDTTALLCRNNCVLCSDSYQSGENWFAPSRTAVNFDYVPGFISNRGRNVIRLKRINGTPAEGIYSCSIQNAAPTIHTVYVGLYNSGKGIIRATCIT